jgi:hypothetical protein
MPLQKKENQRLKTNNLLLKMTELCCVSAALFFYLPFSIFHPLSAMFKALRGVRVTPYKNLFLSQRHTAW